MDAHINPTAFRASETHPNQFYAKEGYHAQAVLFLERVEDYDALIEEAKKGRALLAAKTQAVA